MCTVKRFFKSTVMITGELEMIHFPEPESRKQKQDAAIKPNPERRKILDGPNGGV